MPKIAVLSRMISVCLAAYFSVLFMSKAEMPYEQHVLDRIIVGGQPSEADIERMAAKGVTLVVNARVPGEFDRFDEQALVESLGMTYLNIPIHGSSNIDKAAAQKLHDALQQHGGQVVVHCTVGMRASALLAIEQYLFEGISKDQAMTLAAEAHMPQMRGIVEDIIESLDDK